MIICINLYCTLPTQLKIDTYNQNIMDHESLLLSNSQLQELGDMLRGVLEDNERRLDDLLGEKTDLASTNFMNLYNLVVEQWENKQKVVDNVCAFAMSLIGSVGALLDGKSRVEEELDEVREVKEGMEYELNELRSGQMMRQLNKMQKQRDQLRESLRLIVNKATLSNSQAQTDPCDLSQAQDNMKLIDKVQRCDFGVMVGVQTHQSSCNTEQLQKRQESKQSKAVMSDQGTNTEQEQNPESIVEVKEKVVMSTCEYGLTTDSQLEESQQDVFAGLNSQVSELRALNSQLLQEKDASILQMQEEKQTLEQQIQELREEVQLSKMQVELAEIAVKDVMSRSFSQPNDSFIQDNSKAEIQFLNGDLSCFSNMDESLLDASPNMVHTSSTPCLLLESQQSILQSQPPAPTNAFKKKGSEMKANLEMSQSQHGLKEMSTTTKIRVNESSMLISNTKTVSLQCNLLKNVPKIKMFEKQRPELKKVKTLEEDKGTVPFRARPLTQSQIVRPVRPKSNDKGSLVKVLDFFSRNMVTKRIRVK